MLVYSNPTNAVTRQVVGAFAPLGIASNMDVIYLYTGCSALGRVVSNPPDLTERWIKLEMIFSWLG